MIFPRAPEPHYSIPCPPPPEALAAIRQLSMIANDIEHGSECFKCFLGYDFSHIVEDIEAGKSKRDKPQNPMDMVKIPDMTKLTGNPK